MTDDGRDFNPHVDSEYTPGIPNVSKRAPERKGKPRRAQEDDIASALERRTVDIVAKHRAMYGRWPSR